MSRIRFLIDENVTQQLVQALRLREPQIEVIKVGETGAPPCGTPDPDLLFFVEQEKRVLVTNDKKSFGGHLAVHSAAGRHTFGVVLMVAGHPLSVYLDTLLLIWGATQADEWVDRTDVIPY